MSEIEKKHRPRRGLIAAASIALALLAAGAWKAYDVFSVSPPEPEAKAPEGPKEFPFFSDAWARELARRLNESEVYRASGKGWKYKTALVASADPSVDVPQETAIYLDLADGTCKEAHNAREGEVDACAYVLVATPRTWAQVVRGQRSIHPAILSGKVKLTKGSMLTLIAYMKSANEMVAQATRINTRFPAKLAAATEPKEPSIDAAKEGKKQEASAAP